MAWLRETTGAVAKASLHRAIVTAYGPEPGWYAVWNLRVAHVNPIGWSILTVLGFTNALLAVSSR